jgi:hypothetical protein
MESTSDSAKQFLLSKIDEQATHDGVALDEIERRMFLFSELSGSPDFVANEKFDKDYDSDEYESKVAKLLSRSYASDKKTKDGKALWDAALKALSREDFYGLVMVDQAKIKRANESLWVNTDLWKFLLGMLPFAAIEIGLVAVGAIVVFQPSMFSLHLPDWFRLVLLPVFFWMFWYVGKIFARREAEKSARRNGPQLL